VEIIFEALQKWKLGFQRILKFMLFSFLIQPDFWGRISLLLLVRVEMIDFWKDSF